MRGYKCKNCSFKTGDKRAIVSHYRSSHPVVYSRYGSNDDFLNTFVMTQLITDNFGGGRSDDGGSYSAPDTGSSYDSGSSSSSDFGSSSSDFGGSSGGFDSGGSSW